MIRRAFVVSLWVGLASMVVRAGAEEAASSEPLRVCLVSGSGEYKSNESLAAFQEYLEKNYNAQCSRAFAKDEKQTSLTGLENLDKCDVMVLFTRRLRLEGEDLERIKSYCQSGRPIVGIRTASHAIQTWLDLDKEVLGGDYRGHYGAGPKTRLRIVPSAADHAVLRGVEAWESEGSLYKNPDIADDVTLLMTGRLPDGTTEPVTWVRRHREGRVFYTSLGHPDDFEQESFRRLLANAVFWTAKREPQKR